MDSFKRDGQDSSMLSDAQDLNIWDDADFVDECSSRQRCASKCHMHRVKRVWENLCQLDNRQAC
jgi:hypothetical protein